MNHKLHILFDGEELLEVDSNKKLNLTDDQPTTSSHEQNDVDTIGVNILKDSDTETSASKTDLQSPKINVSLKQEIDDVLNKSNQSNEDDEFSTPELPDNSASITELVTPATPRVYSPEKACIVDLHHTKLPWKDGNVEMTEVDAFTKGLFNILFRAI